MTLPLNFRDGKPLLIRGAFTLFLSSPQQKEGKTISALHSINLTKDWPLDRIQQVINQRVALLQEQSHFLGYTDIRFKDIGKFKSSTPILDQTTPPQPSAAIEPDKPFGEPFPATSPMAQTEPTLPPYASIAKPVAVRGTGGMDPIAQQIVAGLKPTLDELKATLANISPVRGYERLAETFATIVDRPCRLMYLSHVTCSWDPQI